MINYQITYPTAKAAQSGQFVHVNTHPREDQVLRQILAREPNLSEADYLEVRVQLNPSNLGYNPYFGLDKQSIRNFIAQFDQRT